MIINYERKVTPTKINAQYSIVVYFCYINP